MIIPLYYKGNLIKEEDIYTLSEENKIPFNVITEVIDQIRKKGEPLYIKYTGVHRDNIRKFAAKVTTTPEINQAPPEEMKPEKPTKKKEEAPADELVVDPLPLTEKDEVVDSAAISLIRALADPMNGSFIVKEDGCCEVNPENPPEIIYAYQVVANVLKLQELGPALDNKSAWMMGSIVASLEDFFGEEFSISQVCEVETQAYNTIAQKVGVFKAFKDKRYNLPYSHHQEAHYASIPTESKKLILSKAEKFNLSSKNVRSLCSIVKKMEDDQVIQNITTKDQAKDLIDAYKDNKTTYIIYNEGVFCRKSGMIGEVPEGKMVIDVKQNKAFLSGKEYEITKA
jgi:hypothetical protein